MLGFGPVGTDFDLNWDTGDLDLPPSPGKSATVFHGGAGRSPRLPVMVRTHSSTAAIVCPDAQGGDDVGWAVLLPDDRRDPGVSSPSEQQFADELAENLSGDIVDGGLDHHHRLDHVAHGDFWAEHCGQNVPGRPGVSRVPAP